MPHLVPEDERIQCLHAFSLIKNLVILNFPTFRGGVRLENQRNSFSLMMSDDEEIILGC